MVEKINSRGEVVCKVLLGGADGLQNRQSGMSRLCLNVVDDVSHVISID